MADIRRQFGDARAQSLDPARIREYSAKRQGAGVSNGTVNRELAARKRALRSTFKNRKILHRPHVPMLRKNNVRGGFFERDQFDAVLRHLPEEVQPVASFGYLTGRRVSEILSLTWRQIDFTARTVRLEPGTTKNGAGRMFPFTPELRALLEAQRQRPKRCIAATRL